MADGRGGGVPRLPPRLSTFTLPSCRIMFDTTTIYDIFSQDIQFFRRLSASLHQHLNNAYTSLHILGFGTDTQLSGTALGVLFRYSAGHVRLNSRYDD
jgi:hypothetical protein